MNKNLQVHFNFKIRERKTSKDEYSNSTAIMKIMQN